MHISSSHEFTCHSCSLHGRGNRISSIERQLYLSGTDPSGEQRIERSIKSTSKRSGGECPVADLSVGDSAKEERLRTFVETDVRECRKRLSPRKCFRRSFTCV